MDLSEFKEIYEKSLMDPSFDINNVTLPSQLDQSSPFSSEQRPIPNIPLSPTSPGKRSPGRPPRTMKEYEEELSSLKKENFNLKLRIYFIEQNRVDLNLPRDVEELQIQLTDLKINLESKKKELSETEDLLLKSYKVLDMQKKQLEALKADQDVEKQTLQDKIDSLEKELKEYHMKFMETSIHLDDTNALYAMTFGLQSKPSQDNMNDLNEKIKDLEEVLSKERKKTILFEEENFELKSIIARDQDDLKKLHNFIETLSKKLEKQVEERNQFEEYARIAKSKQTSCEMNLDVITETLKQKELEIGQLRTDLRIMEKKLSESLQQDEKHPSDVLRKSIRVLRVENRQLKDQLKELQQQVDARNGSRSAKTRSDHEKELQRQLKESEQRQEKLQTEVTQLKSVYDNGNSLIQTLIKKNKTLMRALEEAKTAGRLHSGDQMTSSREEVTRTK